MADLSDLIGKEITDATLGTRDTPLVLFFSDGTRLVVNPALGWNATLNPPLTLNIQLKESL